MKNKMTIGAVLVIILTVGLIWLNRTPEQVTLAQQGSSYGDLIQKDELPLEPGEVRTYKAAEPVDGMVNTWDITLRVEARDKPKSTDIVLVMDLSTSMTTAKLAAAKAAAGIFVNTLLPSGTTNVRIALVSFGSGVTTHLNGFPDPPNTATTLVNTINGLSVTGTAYTFTQGGLYNARTLLDGSGVKDFKYIVLLTDGVPTYSCDGYPSCTPSQNPQMYDLIHGTRAIAQADLAKGDGYKIYTIALDTDTGGTNVIDQLSSGAGYSYTADQSDLQQKFEDIANSIKSSMADAEVDDPMGSGFATLGPVSAIISISPNGGTVNADNLKNVIWNIPTLIEPVSAGSDIRYAEIIYRLEIDDDILTAVPTVPDGDLFYTNQDAQITYTGADGAEHTADFPDPIVDPVLLEVKKTLQDVDGNPITGSDEAFSITITGPQNYNQTYIRKGGVATSLITNLRYEGVYTVTETTAGNHLTTVKIGNNPPVTLPATFTVEEETAVDDEMDDIVVEVINKVNVMNVTATKTWSGLGAGETAPALWFQLYQGTAAYGVPQLIPAGGTVTWNNVPVADASGTPYVYTVKEGTASGTPLVFTAKVPDGFTADPSGGECTVAGTGGSKGCTITNTRKTVNVTATKAWSGLLTGETPPALWFQLYQGAAAYGVPQPVPTAEPRTVTWSNVPETDTSGVAYVYTVKEGTASGTPLVFTAKVPDGFTAAPSGGECTAAGTEGSRSCTITNTRKTIDFNATKTWSGLGSGETAPALWFQLYQGAAAYGSPQLVPTADPRTVTWSAIPETDTFGTAYVYTVKEGTLSGGTFTEGIPAGWTAGTWNCTGNVCTITNTRKTVNVTATKAWVGLLAGESAPELWFQLYQGAAAYGVPQLVPTADPRTVTWNNVPETNASGVAYVYSVKEGTASGTPLVFTAKVPDGFTSTPADGACTAAGTEGSGSCTITNILKTIGFSATKTWSGLLPGETAPALWFQLYQGTAAYGAPQPVPTTEPRTVTWSDIPETDTSGTPYVYTVKEGTVSGGTFTEGIPAGWTAGTWNCTENVCTITNTRKTIDFSAAKTWSGLLAGETAPELYFQLYQGAAPYGSPQPVPTTEPRTVTWSGIPETNASGTPYVYSVKEGTLSGGIFTEGIPAGWTAGTWNCSGNVCAITNTRKTVNVTATKTWSGLGSGETTPALWFQLYQGAAAYGEPQPIPTTEPRTVTWSNVPETDAFGTPYVYTVKEGTASGTPLVFTAKVPDGFSATPAGGECTAVGTEGSRSCTITNIRDTTGFSATKTWSGLLSGETAPALWFQLYQGAAAYGDPQPVPTADPRTVTWSDIPETDISGTAYIYTVKEGTVSGGTFTEGIPAGWTAGTWNCTGNVCTITNTRKTVNVTATKAWSGLLTGETAPALWFQLYQGAAAYGVPQSVPTAEPRTVTWSNVPETDTSGVAYVYTVKEGTASGTPLVFTAKVPDGFTADPVDGVCTAAGTEGSRSCTITNTRKTIDFNATKTWSGLGSGETAPALWFQLYQGAAAYGSPQLVPTADPRTVTWSAIPETDTFGTAYVYTVKEGTVSGGTFTEGIPAGWTAGTWNCTGNVCTITNTRKTVNVTATKAWVGLLAGESAPELWFQLYQGAAAYGVPQLVPTADPRTVTWSNVPETNASGVAYVYSVKEGTASGTPLVFTAKVPDGFTSTPADGACTAAGTEGSRSCTITNILKTIGFSATKTWSGLLPGETAPALWFQLYQGTAAYGAPQPVPTADPRTVTWSDIPETDTSGVAYVYTVKEGAVSGGIFTEGIPAGWTAGTWNCTENVCAITNTRKTVNVTATKTWSGLLSGETAPDLYFQLYQGAAPYGSPQLVPTADPRTVTWSGIPETNASGTPYVYTVKEGTLSGGTFTEGVPAGWTAGTWNCSGNVCAITNTRKTLNVTATKTWSGLLAGESAPELWFQLYQGAAAYGVPQPVPTADPRTVTWSSVPETDAFGTPYVYTVKEGTASGTPLVFTAKVPDGFTATPAGGACEASGTEGSRTCTITNTRGTIGFSATKTWSGLLAGETAPALWFQLYQGTAAYGVPQPVPTADPRTVTWSDIPETDTSGTAYIYTVKEGTVSGGTFTEGIPEGWTAGTWNCTGNVCTITNTRKTVNVMATKAWSGLGAGETAPELWFQLYQGTAAYGLPQPVPTAGGTVTWNNVPETDASGTAYVYTVKEGTASGTPLVFTAKVPDGFTADPSGGECTAAGTGGSKGCTITNTRKTIDFSAMKTWSGLLAGESAPALWFQLYQGTAAYGSPKAVPAGNPGTVTWSAIPETDTSGTPYVYSVKEGTLATPGDLTTFTEGVPAGWTAGVWNCTENVCTITNSKLPRLTIRKITIPAEDVTSFVFVTGGQNYSAFSLTGVTSENRNINSQILAPGAYTVTEQDTPGWVLSDLNCSGGTDVRGDLNRKEASVTLAYGDAVTCTFTNRKLPTLRLEKTVINDHGGLLTQADFTPRVDGTTFVWDTETAISAGAHTLSEDAVQGYTAGDWSCTINGGQPQAGAQITLNDGDSAVCSIINDDDPPADPPKLTLNKVLVNASKDTVTESNWILTADGGQAGILSGPGAPGDADVVSGAEFQPGIYRLYERAIQMVPVIEGSWSCVINNGRRVTGNRIQLNPGDDVVCTVVNTLFVKVPPTGFSTRNRTILREQPAALAYNPLGFEIELPVLNVVTELVNVPVEDDSGWAVEWLGDRAGLLSGSPLPGDGTSYIAGHNHLDDLRIGPFLMIGQLAENDRIFVRTAEGNLLSYAVYANELVGTDDFDQIYQTASAYENVLVLITCENESLNGGYENRRIVYAKPL